MNTNWVHDPNRTDGAATAALAISFVTAVPALIVCHWAKDGPKRTAALWISWISLFLSVALQAFFEMYFLYPSASSSSLNALRAGLVALAAPLALGLFILAAIPTPRTHEL